MKKPDLCINEHQRRRSAAHMPRLFSTFVVCFRYSIIFLDLVSVISRLYLAPLVEPPGLYLTWSENLEDRFSGNKSKRPTGLVFSA